MIDIESKRIGPATVVALKGRMDSASYDTLMTAVQRELDLPQQQLLLDLNGVDYISTSGLKVLRHLKDTTGNVRIVRPSQRVREVLQITGLDATYQLFDTSPEGVHTVAPVVNAHTRLDAGWLEHQRPGLAGRPFAEWLAITERARASLGDGLARVTKVAAEKGVEALVKAGTTTICDVTSSGASIEALLKSGLRGVIYVEVAPYPGKDGIDPLDHARALIATGRTQHTGTGIRLGLAVREPYAVPPDTWKRLLDYARAESLPLCISAAESRAEYDFFTTGTGPVLEWNQTHSLEFAAPMKSPVHYLEEVGALALKPLLIHAVHVSDDDVRRIKASGAAVVHCPRSNLRLHCGRMPLEMFLSAGVPVHLGTAGLGSSPSVDVLEELEFAIALHHGRVAVETLAQLAHAPLQG